MRLELAAVAATILAFALISVPDPADAEPRLAAGLADLEGSTLPVDTAGYYGRGYRGGHHGYRRAHYRGYRRSYRGHRRYYRGYRRGYYRGYRRSYRRHYGYRHYRPYHGGYRGHYRYGH